jgi:hypothetical protein
MRAEFNVSRAEIPEKFELIQKLGPTGRVFRTGQQLGKNRIPSLRSLRSLCLEFCLGELLWNA